MLILGGFKPQFSGIHNGDFGGIFRCGRKKRGEDNEGRGAIWEGGFRGRDGQGRRESPGVRSQTGKAQYDAAAHFPYRSKTEAP